MKVINLCFHGIGSPGAEREPGESRYWITERTFLDILDLVVGHGEARLSFDDGNRSDVEIALPALRERGLTATFFVLAGRLSDARSLGPVDLQELRTAGMSIGSHGWHHVPWRGLSAEQQRTEFVDAREAIAAASGGEVETAALPLGRYDRSALAGLRRAGYQAVYTSDRFPASDAAWLQARYSVTSADSPADAIRPLRDRDRVRELRQRLASAVKRVR